MRKSNRMLVVVCLAMFQVFVLFSATGVQASEPVYTGAGAEQSPVREFFARVPLTLFENTPEGMGEEERLELLELGTSAYWKIRDETELTLSFESLPFGESVVSVRLFPHKSQGAGQGFMLAAIGTSASSMCTMELWREDKSGRMVPEDTPHEPPIADFFQAGHGVPKDVEPAVLLCLGPQGLEAMPIFWNTSGMAHVPVDNRVIYQWTGTAFEKKVLARVEQ